MTNFFNFSPRAKITLTKRKGKQALEESKLLEFEQEPGITYTIPETKKTLSLGKLVYLF